MEEAVELRVEAEVEVEEEEASKTLLFLLRWKVPRWLDIQEQPPEFGFQPLARVAWRPAKLP